MWLFRGGGGGLVVLCRNGGRTFFGREAKGFNSASCRVGKLMCLKVLLFKIQIRKRAEVADRQACGPVTFDASVWRCSMDQVGC